MEWRDGFGLSCGRWVLGVKCRELLGHHILGCHWLIPCFQSLTRSKLHAGRQSLFLISLWCVVSSMASILQEMPLRSTGNDIKIVDGWQLLTRVLTDSQFLSLPLNAAARTASHCIILGSPDNDWKKIFWTRSKNWCGWTGNKNSANDGLKNRSCNFLDGKASVAFPVDKSGPQHCTLSPT